MPAVEKAKGQKAVLWERSGWDRNGEPKVLAPREIEVSGWQGGRRESIDEDALPIALSATVSVNEAIPIHSIMWKGKLKNLPDNLSDLYEVKDVSSTPDIKNRNVQRTAMLSRWDKPLPTVSS